MERDGGRRRDRELELADFGERQVDNLGNSGLGDPAYRRGGSHDQRRLQPVRRRSVRKLCSTIWQCKRLLA